MTPKKIAIRDVNKQFGHGAQAVQALQHASLDVADNEFITFVGASGCGKSTLLRIIGGLETQSSGQVLLDGAPVTGPGADRAMVFQHYSLYRGLPCWTTSSSVASWPSTSKTVLRSMWNAPVVAPMPCSA